MVELANISDIDFILELYSERMQWFKDNNIKQWSKYPTNHPKSEFEEAINNKNYYIIKNNDKIVAGFEVSTKGIKKKLILFLQKKMVCM